MLAKIGDIYLSLALRFYRSINHCVGFISEEPSLPFTGLNVLHFEKKKCKAIHRLFGSSVKSSLSV